LLLPDYWARRSGFQRSDERISIRESMTAAAREYPAAMLWFGAIFMPLIAAACLIMLIVAPDDWLLWVIGAIISGSVSAIYVRLVMLRHKAGLTG
jgi:hypothetical protein